MKKKVMIYAYTCINLGDDIFIKILCERYPQVDFVIIASYKYKTIFKSIKNLTVKSMYIHPIARKVQKITNMKNNKFVELIKHRDEAKKLRLLGNVEVGVYIGGSIYIQNSDWENEYKKRMERKSNDRPFFVIGANFGPYKDEDFIEKYQQIFKSYVDICFREKYSVELFENLSNVRYASDVVFMYKHKFEKPTLKQISISVIDIRNRPDLAKYAEAYINKIIDIIYYFSKEGFIINLLSFCKMQGDEKVINEILERVDQDYKKSINTSFYSGDINESIEVMSQSEFIIATRFHSMILAWVLNKPVFPIIYSDKMKNVIKDVGFNGKYEEIRNMSELKIEDVLANYKNDNKINIEKYRMDAENQFQKLDEFLME